MEQSKNKQFPKSKIADNMQRIGSLGPGDTYVASDLHKQEKIPTKLYTPIADGVALHVLRFADQTEGGVLIPEISQDNWQTPVGLVIAVGPDVKYVKEGDKVIFGNCIDFFKVKYGGCDFLHMPEKGIAGIIPKEDPE